VVLAPPLLPLPVALLACSIQLSSTLLCSVVLAPPLVPLLACSVQLSSTLLCSVNQRRAPYLPTNYPAAFDDGTTLPTTRVEEIRLDACTA